MGQRAVIFVAGKVFKNLVEKSDSEQAVLLLRH